MDIARQVLIDDKLKRHVSRCQSCEPLLLKTETLCLVKIRGGSTRRNAGDGLSHHRRSSRISSSEYRAISSTWIHPHDSLIRREAPGHFIVLDGDKLNRDFPTLVDHHGHCGVSRPRSLAINTQYVTQHVIQRHHHDEHKSKHHHCDTA